MPQTAEYWLRHFRNAIEHGDLRAAAISLVRRAQHDTTFPHDVRVMVRDYLDGFTGPGVDERTLRRQMAAFGADCDETEEWLSRALAPPQCDPDEPILTAREIARRNGILDLSLCDDAPYAEEPTPEPAPDIQEMPARPRRPRRQRTAPVVSPEGVRVDSMVVNDALLREQAGMIDPRVRPATLLVDAADALTQTHRSMVRSIQPPPSGRPRLGLALEIVRSDAEACTVRATSNGLVEFEINGVWRMRTELEVLRMQTDIVVNARATSGPREQQQRVQRSILVSRNGVPVLTPPAADLSIMTEGERFLRLWDTTTWQARGVRGLPEDFPTEIANVTVEPSSSNWGNERREFHVYLSGRWIGAVRHPTAATWVGRDHEGREYSAPRWRSCLRQMMRAHSRA